MGRYEDSEVRKFSGDIIITDPCYIMRHPENSTEDDWERCDYGECMENLGIKNYLTHDTIYGDWSCMVYDTDSNEKLGDFCADAGLVSVFLLEEVLKYNPKFDYHIERPWTTTLIKDFEGEVQIKVKHMFGRYEYNTIEFWEDGDTWEDYIAYVEGHGVNKRTGVPINFVSGQTGM